MSKATSRTWRKQRERELTAEQQRVEGAADRLRQKGITVANHVLKPKPAVAASGGDLLTEIGR